MINIPAALSRAVFSSYCALVQNSVGQNYALQNSYPHQNLYLKGISFASKVLRIL